MLVTSTRKALQVVLGVMLKYAVRLLPTKKL